MNFRHVSHMFLSYALLKNSKCWVYWQERLIITLHLSSLKCRSINLSWNISIQNPPNQKRAILDTTGIPCCCELCFLKTLIFSAFAMYYVQKHSWTIFRFRFFLKRRKRWGHVKHVPISFVSLIIFLYPSPQP